MANVFKDISQFTLKSAATGTEEFQVSATEKVTAQQIAALAPSQAITNWAKMLESAYSPITNTDTLLAALQKLQVLIENGDGYVFRCYDSNSNIIGVAFGSSDGARGLRAICYHNTSNKLMICSGTVTLPAFIRMSEADQSTWLREHIEHSIPVEDIQIGGVNIFSFSELEQGGINNGTGVPTAINTRLRSKDFYPISGKYISVNSFNDIYKFLWLFYDKEYAYINNPVSWDWITSFPTVAEIPEGAAYVKYTIVRNDNAVLTPDDAKEDCLIKVELGNKPSLSWSPSVADLARSGLNVYTISESESQNQKIDASRVEELKKSELVLFPNEGSYTPYFKVSVDNSKAYFITGNIPINSQGQPGLNNGEEPPFEQVNTVMIEVDLTTYDITIWPYPVIKKSWFKGDVSVIEITDFAIPLVNITKDGQSFLFYANDASNIPNSNHGATSFVGVAIASPIFITGDQRLLYYMMIDTAKAMFYTGYANLEDDAVTWSDTPVTRLGQAVQVTAFTESALSSLLYTYKAGDFIPFYTGNVTTSTENQFPESGIFNGFISMGSNEGDYFQIFAFKTGSPNAYIGACIGSTTQWTQIGGSSAVEKLSTWLEQDTKVAPHINISLGEVQVPLNRALKESDILRIDFMRRSEASTFYMQGVAIVHVGAVDNSIQDYAAALDEQYVDYGTGEFAALAFNASTKLIGHNYFNLHIDTNGSVPQDDYYIMGVYNISGK